MSDEKKEVIADCVLANENYFGEATQFPAQTVGEGFCSLCGKEILGEPVFWAYGTKPKPLCSKGCVREDRRIVQEALMRGVL